MDVNTLTPRALFGKPVRYEVPEFQRPYVWQRIQQWEPFWDDVRGTAEQYLERGSAARERPTHFLGAVVLQQRPHTSSEIETRMVIDGSQTLITLQLLLDAMQKAIQRRGSSLAARRLLHLTRNGEEYTGDDPDRESKVWPSIGDRDDFRQVMREPVPITRARGQHNIIDAHKFFNDEVELWLDDHPEDAEALEEAVTSLIQVVVIDLQDTEESHVIFETLNARGTPLLQSDLVKNMVLHQGRSDGISGDPVHLWDFDDKWWRREIPQGRTKRPRVDVFLNYWIIMRTGREIKAGDVFSGVRDYAQGYGKTIESISSDMRAVGDVYRRIEEERYPEIETFLYRRRIMEAGVLTPVLLWLLSSKVPQHHIEKSLRALESYVVRRMICHTTTMGYSSLFRDLVNVLEDKKSTEAGDIIVEYLATQTANQRLWPSDRQVKDVFVHDPLYRMLRRARLRILLEGIESAMRTDKTELSSVTANLTIEHIMPQAWRQNWKLPADPQDRSRAEEERDRLVNSIGNLTLVTRKLNAAMSNVPWQDKRLALRDHSVLFLNKDLEEAPDVWDEAAITERAERLCQAAIKVWPHADGIR